MRKLTALIIVALIVLINFTSIVSIVDGKDNNDNDIDGTHQKTYTISGTCGWVQSYDANYHNAVNGISNTFNDNPYSWVGQQHSTVDNKYGVTRTYMQFDTSEIPSGATINSVIFNGDLLSVLNTDGATFPVRLDKLNSAYTTPLGLFTSTDWNIALTPETSFFNSMMYVLGDFSLGVSSSFVNKAGITYAVLRGGEGISPNIDAQNFFEFDLNDFSISVTATMTNPTSDAGSDQTDNRGNINFDGSGSLNGMMPITNYEWTFTDGTPKTLSGVITSYNFQNLGVFTVILTVTDDFGNYDTDVMIVNILNILPVADAGSNQAGNKGTYDFNGGGSTDSDGTISDYDWSFFYDGSTRHLSGVTPDFNFQIGDVYTVILEVTDNDGGTDTDNVIITIENILPVADAGLDDVTFQDIYDFDGSNSYDLDGF